MLLGTELGLVNNSKRCPRMRYVPDHPVTGSKCEIQQCIGEDVPDSEVIRPTDTGGLTPQAGIRKEEGLLGLRC